MLLENPDRVCYFTADESQDDLPSILEQGGYRVGASSFLAPNMEDNGVNLMLVNGEPPENSLQFCQHLRKRLGDNYVPILFISGASDPATRLASLECGADAYLLRPFEPEELLAQTRALIRIKERHDRLVEKSAEAQSINKRLQAAYQQIDNELELAGRIQSSFLPQRLPELPQVRFAVHYRPCGRVGGDFYDVFRLDEKHLGLYIADAMGHGVPASLLTIFVKKGIRPKEIDGNSYRLVPPGAVLDGLNRDLVDQQLSDSPFITMVYALFNFADGIFQFARSGHPYPIYVPYDSEIRLWQIEGTLLGVFDTKYTTASHQLRPGDKVVLYTDGVDAARRKDEVDGVPGLMRCVEKHRSLSIDEMLTNTAAELYDRDDLNDDLTLLGMEVLE